MSNSHPKLLRVFSNGAYGVNSVMGMYHFKESESLCREKFPSTRLQLRMWLAGSQCLFFFLSHVKTVWSKWQKFHNRATFSVNARNSSFTESLVPYNRGKRSIRSLILLMCGSFCVFLGPERNTLNDMCDPVWLISAGRSPDRAVVPWSCSDSVPHSTGNVGFPPHSHVGSVMYVCSEGLTDSRRRCFGWSMCVINTHVWKTTADAVIEHIVIVGNTVFKRNENHRRTENPFSGNILNIQCVTYCPVLQEGTFFYGSLFFSFLSFNLNIKTV